MLLLVGSVLMFTIGADCLLLALIVETSERGAAQNQNPTSPSGREWFFFTCDELASMAPLDPDLEEASSKAGGASNHLRHRLRDASSPPTLPGGPAIHRRRRFPQLRDEQSKRALQAVLRA